MKRVMEPDSLVNLAEAAALLRVCRSTLYSLMDSGELAYVKIGKCRRLRMSALLEFIERNTHTGGGACREPKRRGSADDQNIETSFCME